MGTIGTRVQTLRKAKGLSGAELARQVGISQPSLVQIEQGRTKSLKATTLHKFCEVLHTTPDFLLKDSIDEEANEQAMLESELIYTVRKLSDVARGELVNYARYLLSQEPASAGSPHRPQRRKSITADASIPKDALLLEAPKRAKTK